MLILDQQINKGVTILIDIIDPDYLEELELLIHMELVMFLSLGKMKNGQFKKTGQIKARQPKAKTSQG